MDDAWLFRGRRPSLAKIGDTDALDLLGRWGAWGSPGLLACSLREAYPFFLGCGQKKLERPVLEQVQDQTFVCYCA